MSVTSRGLVFNFSKFRARNQRNNTILCIAMEQFHQYGVSRNESRMHLESLERFILFHR